LEALRLEKSLVDEIELGVSEACANAVRHAASGRSYLVEVELLEACCIVVVADTGVGFVAEDVPPPHVGSPSGRGLVIMREMMTSIEVESVPGQSTAITLVRHLPVQWSIEERRRATQLAVSRFEKAIKARGGSISLMS
jgi:serine/threonine-protein kinase RsbW